MIKKLNIILIIVVLLSCGKKNSKKTGNKELDIEKSISYSSDGNDLAEIKLTLIPNGNLNFNMDIYSENDLQDDDLIHINLTGNWTGTNKKILLNFKKSDSISLNDIFDSNYKQGNEFNVIDNNRVEIDFTLDKINIWGIACYKSKD